MKKQKVDLRGIETAVVTVGEGRGFIVDALDQRLVITAAHCLPHLPSAPPGSWEETYRDLIGPLNGSKPKVSVECLFVDPISDIAVLGCPDDQSLFDEAEAYEALVAEATALRISSPPEQAPAWLLTLDGRWSRCLVKHHGSRRDR